MKNKLLKTVAASIFILFAVASISFNNKKNAKLPNEPADPDKYDMSVWEKVEPGVHSGFGSIDVAYSKSIPPGENVAESIKLQGWKGELVSCMLLIWSSGKDEEISIQANGLSNDHSRISKDCISISVLRYVLSDEFSKGCGSRNKDSIPAHISPDYLSNANSFKLDAPGTRPVWISVDIPSPAPAGIYNGTISIQSASGNVNHTISLEVLDKLLPPPSEWSFHLDLWQNPFAVARYHGVELWSKAHVELLRPLLKKLANAGQKCITATLIDKPWDDGGGFDLYRSMIDWTREKDGSWKYDYSIFDQYVNLAMECGINKQINCYSMVPITNKFTWYDKEISKTVVKELLPGTKDYENFWRPFLIDFRAHLRQKGWLNITTLALDEREEEEMKNMFSFLKQTAPEFKIAMAGFYYKSINPIIYDFSSNWRDGGRIPEEVIESRKKSGLITTYYVACGIPKPNNFTFSPPSESCYEGWLAAAMGFDGFLRWAYNSWPENPVVDSRYNKWPSGDTYLVYPNALSSVRFERLREGIQDYEKIRILREELAKNSSEEAASGLKRLNDFLNSINSRTLENKSATEVVKEGKRLVYEVVKSTYPDQLPGATGLFKDPGLKLMGNRFLTLCTLVRVNQIEVSRNEALGEDESAICYLKTKDEKRQNKLPTHKTTQLQTASADTKPKFAKELFSCQRTAGN